MRHKRRYALLACAITTWLSLPAFAAETTGGGSSDVTIKDVVVEADRAKEEAKYESQQTTIITAEDIEKKQAKSVEEIIFNETGVTRTIDAMGRVGVSIRGAEPRHTLILIDGQPVMGDVSKYSGQGDELQRLGTENVERIEIIKGAASAKYGSDAIGGVINVVTKRPQKEAGFQFNVEGRRAKGDSDLFPYQNVFLRADSGQVGKFRAAVYGSKRDIMPVYEIATLEDTDGTGKFMRNSLRYYGDIKNIGFIGTYDINDRNAIDINVDRTTEDLERYVRYSESGPQQQFKRDVTRDKTSLTYRGNNGGSTDWNISYNYSKLTEDDISLSSFFGSSSYEGKNTLESIDDLEHKQWNVDASANTQINDDHLLSYGFGFSQETAEGSRIKNAPQSYLRSIDPWNYDKNLQNMTTIDEEGNLVYTNEGASNVHAYKMSFDENGYPYWDKNYEYYGSSTAPALTQEDYNRLTNNGTNPTGLYTATGDDLEKINQFASQLKQENSAFADYDYNQVLIMAYYNPSLYGTAFPLTLNGKKFMEEYNKRNNTVEVGQAELKKQYFFLQDTWQVNDRTILSPIVRLDHSDLFGSEVTFNIGLTHNVGGKTSRRFKANIGTGYTAPGLGELYYNWEMYGGTPAGTVEGIGSEVGRLGYYWVGNPDLKPEKSVNMDIGFELESGKTATRFNVFHNKITDYMTTYFTGALMDFHPGDSTFKWLQPPDMIYSFKNIGKAEITGVEAELNHQFNDHWSAHLGYTYLHAINKSDPDMPRQLLDKPQHKVDIGLTYENKGWRASLWGNYYINMLDSNSIAGNGNYMQSDSNGTHYFFEDSDKISYQKKTFGLWNLLIQKELSKDSSVYFGIDNLFNHRDDDRALMERVYKVGANFKFGPDAHTMSKELDKAVGEAEVAPEEKKIKLQTDWFIQRPFDVDKTEGVEIIGDYRARWNSFTGQNKPEARVTATSSVGTAEKNILEKAGHGFEQRLRLGLDARIGENTNVTVLGSASGMSGVDTQYDISDSKGLNHQRLETVDVTQHAKKWDFSVGRLTEPLGVTGYWFGKEYDGVRVVWTNDKTQVRIGYGDFSSSTDITDSAYTHATIQTFFRAPTKAEWLGYSGQFGSQYTDGSMTVTDDSGNVVYEGLYQKLANASSPEEQGEIISQYLQVIQEKNPDMYEEIAGYIDRSLTQGIGPVNTYAWELVTVTDSQGNSRQFYNLINTSSTFANSDGIQLTADDLKDMQAVTDKTEAVWEDSKNQFEVTVDNGKTTQINNSHTNILTPGRYTVTSEFLGYGKYTGNIVLQELGRASLDKANQYRFYTQAIAVEDVQDGELIIWGKDDTAAEKAKEMAGQSLWNPDNALQRLDRNTGIDGAAVETGYSTHSKIGVLARTFITSINTGWNPENGSSLPLQETLAGAVGGVVKVTGTVLVQDQIPSIEQAAFAQVKHQFGDNFGVQAWYLRSLNDDTHSIAYANGDHNDVASFDELANVVGIGATYRLNDKIRFSYEWGQNRTDFGRFMNGHTIYRHEEGTSDFDIAGRANGGTPRFWVARIDVGHADTEVPGSWNAFADYKYFEHGSFFGGNGTESLPDRYLDGIKSFTIGGGYVPAKDFLIEAFYTFGAKGIGKRDTLYGSENFELGDYTRLQVTYKF